MPFLIPIDAPAPVPRQPTLRDYRDRFTPGHTLGLACYFYDSAYQATRATHPAPHTVVAVSDAGVTFARQGHVHPPLPWETELNYLKFGSGPYTPGNNILLMLPRTRFPGGAPSLKGPAAYIMIKSVILNLQRSA